MATGNMLTSPGAFCPSTYSSPSPQHHTAPSVVTPHEVSLATRISRTSPIVCAPQQLWVAHCTYPPSHWNWHCPARHPDAPWDVAGCAHTVQLVPHALTLSSWHVPLQYTSPPLHVPASWPIAPSFAPFGPASFDTALVSPGDDPHAMVATTKRTMAALPLRIAHSTVTVFARLRG